MEDSRKTWFTESAKQGSCGLTETERVSTRPAWVSTQFSLCVCNGCQLGDVLDS